MEELKSLFGEESLNYEQFEQKLTEAQGIKLANLKTGNYVDKAKYEKVEKSISDLQEKFNALSDNTKGYEELKANYETIKAEKDALQDKLNGIEKVNLVKDAGVDKEFVEFVCDKVSKLTDENKDFQTALKEYLEENKKFLVVPKGSYVDLQYGQKADEDVNAKFNKAIRSLVK